MISALIGVAVFALFIVLCFRHFFIQMIALKLLMDTVIFILLSVRSPQQDPGYAQSAGVFVATLSAEALFVLMAAGILRFSRAKAESLEVPHG